MPKAVDGTSLVELTWRIQVICQRSHIIIKAPWIMKMV